jgi:DNA-binding phage protein
MATKIKTRKIKLAPYDSADYLKTDADIKNYLERIIRRAYRLADADSR